MNKNSHKVTNILPFYFVKNHYCILRSSSFPLIFIFFRLSFD